MPRAKRAAATDTPAVKATRTRRRAKAKTAAAPEAEEEEEEDEAPKKTRGRRGKAEKPAAEKPARAKLERIYVKTGLVWDELDNGKDTKVRLNKEAPGARGAVQTAVYEFMGEKGRRGAKASDIIEMMQTEEIGVGRESGVVSHLINVGVLEVA